jgi:universal stress protein E
MSGHILIATDLSGRSNLALERALYLAKSWDAACTLLHVADDESPPELIKKRVDNVRAYLEEYLEKLRLPDRAMPDIMVKSGGIHEIINDTAREKRSRVIVMGAHRKNILLDVFRGTTIERVLRTGNTPVLMVGRPVENGYDSVIFGVDGDLCSRQAIDAAFSFGLFTDARMTAVHAYQDIAKTQMVYAGIGADDVKKHEGTHHNQTAEKMYEFLVSTKLGAQNYRLILEQADPSQLIVKAAADLDSDLIVIGTRSLTGVKKAMLGSVAEGVLRHAHSDVLVVPPVA